MLNSNPFSQEEYATAQTILIVEDDLCIGMLLVEAIHEETPHKAILVTDGEQALQLTRNLKPDLFLLDYNLPSMNGLDLYDLLHATQGFAEIPALFISANVPVSELEKRRLGFVRKPFELDDVIKSIDMLLSMEMVADGV